MAKDLTFWIYEKESVYYLCSENRALISCSDIAQMICAFVFAYKNRFSYDTAHISRHVPFTADDLASNYFNSLWKCSNLKLVSALSNNNYKKKISAVGGE